MNARWTMRRAAVWLAGLALVGVLAIGCRKPEPAKPVGKGAEKPAATPDKPAPTPDKPTPPTPDKPEPAVPDKPEPTPDKPTPPAPDKPEPTPDKPTPPTPDKPEPAMPDKPVLPTPDKPEPTPVPPTPDKPAPDKPEPTPDKPVPPTPDKPEPAPDKPTAPAAEKPVIPPNPDAPKFTLQEKYRPKLLVSLSIECHQPDGMRLNPKTGEIIVSVPNFTDTKYQGKLIKITKDNKWEIFYDKLPAHPETDRACPMGLDFGPDGHLYYADNQYFSNKDHRSRLIRVKIENDKPVGAEVVVDGFKLSNAVMWKGNELFVSDTFFDLPDKPGASGVYRFTLDELNKGPVKLKPKTEADPHLLVQLETKPLAWRANEVAGADGITFDSKGNLYTGNFGDGQLFRIRCNDDGTVKAKELVIGPPTLSCVDGLFCDLATDKIYVADSERNAIQVVSQDGTMETLWQDDDNDGSDGKLDQPCEPLIRGDELIIANFDMPFPGLKNSKFDPPYTISVIKLK